MLRNKINSAGQLLLIAKLLFIVPVIILYIHYFFHQNWGFFIVKPHGPTINIYQVNDERINKEPLIKNNTGYGVGMSRKGRILYHEFSRLINDRKNLLWKHLNKDSLLQIIKTENFTVIYTNNSLLDKGKLLITKEELLPGLSMKSVATSVAPLQYTLAEIR